MEEFDPSIYPLLERMALAIQKHEGWSKGSRSYRNNNPGNFVCTEYVKKYLGAIGCEKGGRFAVFRNYEEGFFALELFIFHAASDQLRNYASKMTLLQYFQKYAPSSDGNNPKNYAAAVAADLGVKTNFKIAGILATNAEVPPEAPEVAPVPQEVTPVVIDYSERPKGTSRREWFAKITGLPREMYNKVFKSAETLKIAVKDLSASVGSAEFETYEVQAGDTLAKIAVKLCGKESLWQEILEANKSEIENAALIYIGQKLKIPKSLMKK